jgi:hypothetical protein
MTVRPVARVATDPSAPDFRVPLEKMSLRMPFTQQCLRLRFTESRSAQFTAVELEDQ